MKTTFKFILTISMLSLITMACKKKNDPSPENPIAPNNDETELITTIQLMLEDTVTHSLTTYQFSDVDGVGGNPAIYGGTNQSDSVIHLLQNKVYSCRILLLDETKNPIDTISNEVINEAEDHQVFFNALNPSGTPPSVFLPNSMLTIKYMDLDANNKPLGLNTIWQTPSMPMNKSLLKVELKHQPQIKDGTYTPGNTDIQVEFKVQIN